METHASPPSPPSPPVGWALTQDVPPGHVKEKPRPGTKLWIAYLILFASGFILSFIGHSMIYQAGTATAGLTPAAETHSGQVIGAIGFVFIVAGLVVAVVSLVLRFRSSRGTTEGSARSPAA